jgi:DNA (cytosine-5)-methyltransferase 1
MPAVLRPTPNSSAAQYGDPIGLSFVDLFAGCGGLSFGFRSLGFRPVGAVEWEADAAETYRRNIDSSIEVIDIEAVASWPRANVVVGGPPCQGFSQLGTRDPNDPRNRLWQQYVRALDESHADVFVMENVPQLLRSGQFDLFRAQVEAMGFMVSSRVLNAADYGVPQARNRAIVIGSRLGLALFPPATHGLPGRGRKPHATVRTAFTRPSVLPEQPHGKNWHVGRPNVRPTSIARYRAVPKDGGNRFQMQANLERAGRADLVPECWRRKPTGTTDVFGRLWWDRPALTIRTEFFKPEKGRYLHPTANRPITIREAARLQSFPDSFVFPNSQSMVSVAKQIGNAVPPMLGAALAKAVLKHFEEYRGVSSAIGHDRRKR